MSHFKFITQPASAPFPSFTLRIAHRLVTIPKNVLLNKKKTAQI